MQPALTCIHTGLPNNSIPSSQDPDFTTSPCQQAQEGRDSRQGQTALRGYRGRVPGDKSWLDIPWSPLFLFH